jgi:hypothetical protein
MHQLVALAAALSSPSELSDGLTADVAQQPEFTTAAAAAAGISQPNVIGNGCPGNTNHSSTYMLEQAVAQLLPDLLQQQQQQQNLTVVQVLRAAAAAVFSAVSVAV